MNGISDANAGDNSSADSLQSSPQHTPGPWVVHEQPNWPFDITIVGAHAQTVVEDRRWAYSTEQDTLSDVMAGVGFRGDEVRKVVEGNARQMANARLIAAAPELLEALTELVDLIDAFVAGEYRPDSFTTQPGRAALSKATGGAG